MSAVHHPKHYNAHASGIECIDVAERMGFNLGNAAKYVWRAGLKGQAHSEDLAKALFYLDRALAGATGIPSVGTRDQILLRYAERMLHHPGFVSTVVFHLANATVTGDTTHLSAARNLIAHARFHPAEELPRAPSRT